MDIKKQIEREQLIKFISHDQLKLLVYNIEDSETPDFIVDIDKKLTSIEHTRLINPNLQKVEKYREKIIKNAQTRFEDKYADKLRVLLTFSNIQLKSGIQEELNYTNEVFNLIEKIYLDNKHLDFRISSNRNKENVSSTIESFSVNNKDNFSCWQHFGAYLVEWIDLDWLQKIIFKKENNLAKYFEKYEENWLLLVSDFGTKASANRTDFLDFSVIQSKFDKIYIFSYISNEITVIK